MLLPGTSWIRNGVPQMSAKGGTTHVVGVAPTRVLCPNSGYLQILCAFDSNYQFLKLFGKLVPKHAASYASWELIPSTNGWKMHKSASPPTSQLQILKTKTRQSHPLGDGPGNVALLGFFPLYLKSAALDHFLLHRVPFLLCTVSLPQEPFLMISTWTKGEIQATPLDWFSMVGVKDK